MRVCVCVWKRMKVLSRDTETERNEYRERRRTCRTAWERNNKKFVVSAHPILGRAYKYTYIKRALRCVCVCVFRVLQDKLASGATHVYVCVWVRVHTHVHIYTSPRACNVCLFIFRVYGTEEFSRRRRRRWRLWGLGVAVAVSIVGRGRYGR